MRRDLLPTIGEKTAAQLRRRFDALMAEIGARPSHIANWYDVELDTPGGLLFLRSPRPEDGWIFTRFDDPKQARQIVGCNPYSGKWNFHPPKGPAPEMFRHFENELRNLMTKPEA